MRSCLRVGLVEGVGRREETLLTTNWGRRLYKWEKSLSSMRLGVADEGNGVWKGVVGVRPNGEGCGGERGKGGLLLEMKCVCRVAPPPLEVAQGTPSEVV